MSLLTKSKSKLAITQKYNDHIMSVLYETIGFKKSSITKLLKSVTKHEWSMYESNYNTFDTISEIIHKDINTYSAFIANIRKSIRDVYEKILLQIKDHYNDIHLIDMIIEYAFGKYAPLIKNKSQLFLYNPTEVDKWFLKDNIHHYNLNETDCESALQLLRSNNSSNTKMFYHTTSWIFATKIMSKGPDHTKGRPCLDFGVEPSFYMTPTLNTAIDWVQSKRAIWRNECAILVFSLQENLSRHKKNKFFTDASNEWETLTSSSRKCQDNVLDDYNFVYGPMVANPFQIEHRDEVAKAHTEIKWQIASKNTKSDNILKKTLIGVIWIGNSLDRFIKQLNDVLGAKERIPFLFAV